VFELQFGQRHVTRFYIDPESYLNVGREDRVFDDDGTLNIIRRVYSDHLEVKGLTIPGKVETYFNDTLSRTFHLSNAELNPGVIDSFFTRPNKAATP